MSIRYSSSEIIQENDLQKCIKGIRKVMKQNNEVCFTFHQKMKDVSVLNKEEATEQMKLWRQLRKEGKLAIRFYNNMTVEWEGKKFYQLCVQPYKNGEMIECSFDPMALLIFYTMVSGYCYYFRSEENRNAVLKYVMGKDYIADPDEKRFKCVLCNQTTYGWGNNPYPLAEEGICCDTCNGCVIEERIKRQMRNM